MNSDYIINLSYDIEYYNHRIFVTEQISKQCDMIYNIFDDLLIENLVKLYILNKKNKLDKQSNLYINIIFDFIYKLKNINKLSNTLFLDIMLLLIKIIIILPYLIELLNNTIYKELLNLEIIKIKFIFLLEELCKNNLLIFNLNKLLNKNIKIENKTEKEKEIIESIIKILACEYFMDYNAIEILKLITTKLKTIKNNLILINLIKYQKKFIYEYDELSLKYNDLYSDIKIMMNINHNYKISNNFFLEMINDINKLENIIK
jgi:hypothetical protein